MPIYEETCAVLAMLKDVQQSVRQNEDLSQNPQVNADLKTLISVLDSPVFQSILNIQDSLRELKKQVALHPSTVPEDFDITPRGDLIINLPPEKDEQPEENEAEVTLVDITTPDSPAYTAASEEVVIPESSGAEQGYGREVEVAARGRMVISIQLFKPEGRSLGFSVVGLRSEDKGELGIYVQEIQPGGIAGQDGQLQDGDQILAIDGHVLDANISHQQAISILQQAEGHVDLVVARGDEAERIEKEETSSVVRPESSTSTETLPSDWCQVDVIDLVNDGTGLGFGIIGGHQTGVVVKTILPNGVADRDGRLLPGDFILQINEHWLRGEASDQVAAVLRGCGSGVRLVVARPVDPNDASSLYGSAPVLPTSVLANQIQLETHLQVAMADIQKDVALGATALPDFNQTPEEYPSPEEETPTEEEGLNEMEMLDVELFKDSQGLGITIAGYTCEKEELTGIFVKSVVKGSTADRSGRVEVNDQIVEVDGTSLKGYTNQQAVEMLRSTGRTVRLKLVRYIQGLRFEQLQKTVNSNKAGPAQVPKRDPLSSEPVASSANQNSPNLLLISPRTPPQPPTRTDSLLSDDFTAPTVVASQITIVPDTQDEYIGVIKPEVEKTLKERWLKVVGQDFQIIVAQISKFAEGGGLGISLEGTVEKVGGTEQNPHHYIRSVLPNGPVGQNSSLRSGDELLEVNGTKLLGLYHTDVVAILKDLPTHVRLICARPLKSNEATEDRPVFGEGGTLSGLVPSTDRLVKARSDESISATPHENTIMSKIKSQSLEPLPGPSGRAMWSDDVITLELEKAERGLGFSILDYQDPTNPSQTVIVIRSLVPGGVAQVDGRLIPGDRLMFVNQTILENASLDAAVQALKGAPQGMVRIGVAKPMPAEDNVTVEEESSMDISQQELNASQDETNQDQPPPLPTSPVPDLDDSPNNEQSGCFSAANDEANIVRNQVMIHSPERLIGASDRLIARGNNSVTVETRYEQQTDADTFPPLPEPLEQKLKLIKDSETLGLQVDIEDGGVNGMVVRALTRDGSIGKDGRIQPGDYLVAVNGQNMRGLSQVDALSILRQTKMVPFGSEISITFIPATDALIFRTSHLTRVAQEEFQQQNETTTKRSSSVFQLTKNPVGTTVIPVMNREISAKNTTTLPVVNKEMSANNPTVPDEETTTADPGPLRSMDSVSVNSMTLSTSSADMDSPRRPVATPRASLQCLLQTNSTEKTTEDCNKSAELGNESEVQVHDTSSERWEPEHEVEIWRVPDQGVGISIVGKIEAPKNPGEKNLSGIFIQNVLEDSPAGKGGELKSGDRILAVGEVDLRHATHDMAWLGVESIRQAGNPLRLTVQSPRRSLPRPLMDNSNKKMDTSTGNVTLSSVSSPSDEDETRIMPDVIPGMQMELFTHDEAESEPVKDDERISTSEDSCAKPQVDKFDSDIETSVITQLENIYIERATIPINCSDPIEEQDKDLEDEICVDQESAAFLNKSESDSEEEDEFGYTRSKIQEKYSQMNGSIIYVQLNKGPSGLGISLSGHKDSPQMAAVIAGLHPLGNAYRDGHMQVGDQLLEVNGRVLHNRSHLNASAIIKNLPEGVVTFVVLQPNREDNSMDIPSNPSPEMKEDRTMDRFASFEVSREIVMEKDDTSPEMTEDWNMDRYASFGGLREVVLEKGDRGLGVMLVEEKHGDIGPGVFISGIQKGSVAAKAGLLVGDMLLAVNNKDFLGATYEMAANYLKKSEGQINITVANPNFPKEDISASENSPDEMEEKHSDEENTNINEEDFLSRNQKEPPKVFEKPKLPPKPLIAPKPTIIKPIGNNGTLEKKTTVQPLKKDSPPLPKKDSPPFPKKDSPPLPPKPNSPNPPTENSPPLPPKHVVLNPMPKEKLDLSKCQIIPGQDTIIEIIKEKDENGKPMGLGLSVVGGSDTMLGAIFIHEVYEAGAAHRDGRLQPGDQILEVMKEDLRDVSHSFALHALRQTPSKVRLVVHREDDEIYENMEVELVRKSDRGLGLSIVGKKSGPGVFISEVVKGGTADVDGRLVQGDQIIAVNGNDLKNSNQEEAAPVLKMAQGRIVMCVRRLKVGNRQKNGGKGGGEEMLPSNVVTTGTPATVNLTRGDHGLGFSIVGGFGSPHGDMPIFVKTVFDKGAAKEHGGIKRGDQILSVNDVSLKGMSHEEAVNILKSSEGNVKLNILS